MTPVYTSWLFWATAVPVTLVIILLSLVWTGTLGVFWKKFSGSGKRNAEQPVDLPTMQAMRRMLLDEEEDPDGTGLRRTKRTATFAEGRGYATRSVPRSRLEPHGKYGREDILYGSRRRQPYA